MSARELARVLAAGRIAVGAGLLAAPRLTMGLWIGSDGARPTVGPPARALGVREVVLGAMALHTLGSTPVARRWLRTLSVCDVVDLAAMIAARRALPAHGLILVGALASGGVAGQLWAASRLADEPSPST